MLVGEGDKVVLCLVQFVEWYGKDWVVIGGLQVGDKVIVDNLMKLCFGVFVVLYLFVVFVVVFGVLDLVKLVLKG